jgi:site-specific recombinase XerD
MKVSSPLVGPLLQRFLTEHLPQHKHASPQTILGYRDTFRLVLCFLRQVYRIAPTAVRIVDLDVPVILAFLDMVEQERHNSVRSRNARLAAIRSFFRWVALCDPGSLGQATRVLAIPNKRAERVVIGALTRTEMDALLATPDHRSWQGRRDYALLLTLYNSGARVSEVISLHRSQVHFGASTFLPLLGKGRKERTVPLWTSTAQTLRTWFQELDHHSQCPFAFPSIRNTGMSRDAVEHLLHQAVQRALPTCPSLAHKRVSPHTIRHSCALHLLQAGVSLAVIALWLGHESIETTHMYVEADLAMKEQALQKLTPHEALLPRFKADDPLLEFLASL